MPDRLRSEHVDPLAWLATELEDLRQHGLYRTLSEFESAAEPEIVYQGRRYLLLASNNYLGLAADSRVVHAAGEALRRYGASTAASRLVSGSTPLHRELESELASLKGTEAALLFSSGLTAAASAARSSALGAPAAGAATSAAAAAISIILRIAYPPEAAWIRRRDWRHAAQSSSVAKRCATFSTANITASAALC